MRFFKTLNFVSGHLRPGTPAAYVLAAVLAVVAATLAVALDPDVKIIPLFLAVLASAAICGIGAGFFSLAISLPCAWYFITPPLAASALIFVAAAASLV